MEIVHEQRRIFGPRHRVIHVGAGQQLTLLIIDGAFAQGLPDPLDDTAMRLTIDQQRVDDDAEIVDERVFDDVNDASLRVDLDLGDVTAVREGRGRAVIDVGDIEALR